MMHALTYFLLLLALFPFTEACYITNCPIGGKRRLALDQHQQCPRCGLSGQCFGPSICCNGLGCRLGHPSDREACATENHRLTPCTIESSSCSAVPYGRCAGRGICCGPDSCRLDETCSTRAFHPTDNLPS